jgi:hypothetical protein
MFMHQTAPNMITSSNDAMRSTTPQTAWIIKWQSHENGKAKNQLAGIHHIFRQVELLRELHTLPAATF